LNILITIPDFLPQEDSILIVSLGLASLTFIPKLKSKHWAVRGFEFIKLQLTALQGLLFIYICVNDFTLSWKELISVLALACALYFNLKRIFDFTFMVPKEVNSSRNSIYTYSILTINIHKDNPFKKNFLNRLNEINPDILLLLEADDKWCSALHELKNQYPYMLVKPQHDRHGIALYSKHPIEDGFINHIVNTDIPSIDCYLNIRGRRVHFYGIHPELPSPTQPMSVKDRDAEVLRLASRLRDKKETSMVSGNFNIPIWSKTSFLFTKESGLVDPRIGRGFYPTLSALSPKVLRLPVDQLFHTKDIECTDLETVAVKGAQHLGLMYTFTLSNSAASTKNSKQLTKQEKKFVEESKHQV